MAEAENNDDMEGGANYQASDKALTGADAILNADKDDEALRKYKESLGLGKTVVIDENNENAVIPNSITMKFFDKENKFVRDIVVNLKKPEKLYQVKQGHWMELHCDFQVQKRMASDVTLTMKAKTGLGFTAFNFKHALGSYAGNNKDMKSWKAKHWDEIPSGMAARTTVKTTLRLTALELRDGPATTCEILNLEFKIKISKKWGDE